MINAPLYKRNIREDPQVHLGALQRLELLDHNVACGGELFLGPAGAPFPLMRIPQVAIGESRAFCRATGGDGDAPFVSSNILYLFRRECSTTAGEYAKWGEGQSLHGVAPSVAGRHGHGPGWTRQRSQPDGRRTEKTW